MAPKLMLVYVGFDVLFAGLGGLIMGFSLMAESQMRTSPTVDNVAQNLLLSQCPLTAGIVNAIFVFVTFLLSLPALFLPQNRGWLRAQGWLVIFCATFTLSLGITIWVSTLATRRHLGQVWGTQPALIQSLLQQKFNCCGYFNSTSPPFQQDSTCLNTLVAAQKGGCIVPFAAFANNYLDVIFTAAFAIVVVDVIVVMCIAMVLKYRQEQERYRHIDEKNGTGGF